MKKAITKEVLLGFNKRNEKEFRKVFDVYFKPLIFYSFKLIRDLHEGQDIVLHVFNKLWHNDFTCQTNRHLEAYLFTAVKNACINYMHSAKINERRNTQPIPLTNDDEDDEREIIDTSTIEATIETIEEFEEKIKRLNEFIQKLPKGCREVIRLQLFGYSGKEISAILGVKSSTVDNQRHRAVIKLKEYFGLNPNQQQYEP